MFLCYNINIEQKFEEEYIMKNNISKELFNLIKQLDDKQADKLINLFRQEKSEEHEGRE